MHFGKKIKQPIIKTTILEKNTAAAEISFIVLIVGLYSNEYKSKKYSIAVLISSREIIKLIHINIIQNSIVDS